MIPQYFAPKTDLKSMVNHTGYEIRDCYSCTVNQQMNGDYTCSINCSERNTIELDGFIRVKSSNRKPPQIFKIKSITKGINTITITCEHIKFLMNDIPIVVPKIGAATVQYAMFELTDRAKSLWTSFPFSITSESQSEYPFNWDGLGMYSLTEYLTGQNDFSIANVSGGWFDFDNFDVTFMSAPIVVNGCIEYGKNLMDIQYMVDSKSIYNAVFPYFYKSNADGETEICYYQKPTPTWFVVNNQKYGGTTQLPIFDSIFTLPNYIDGDPLRIYRVDVGDSDWLKNRVNNTNTRVKNAYDEWAAESGNISKITAQQVTAVIQFADLQNSPEFADVQNLENIDVGYSLRLVIPPANINTTATVSGLTYDALTESLISITVDNLGGTISRTIAKQTATYREISKKISAVPSLITTLAVTPTT